MNDMVIEHNVVVPVVWRNNQSVAAHGLKGMQLTGWDSTLWRLAYWYKQA
jgi:hypothetical protein